ncbi:ABC transporter permease [Halonatronum saccharophilum]|uniref:ABC transporter permease n=1 Tax=Halonatronum saccharophilum TaxID=150060 RepID=UPI00047FEE92|nr:ABC transporter permease [Halonatronum saccharophilum]
MFFETINIALRGLSANKLRTFLSMLGIIIGVGAVITIVSIGTGSQQQIISQISNLGSNLININRGFTRGWGGRVSSDANVSFTLEMRDYIQESSPAIKNIIANAQGQGLFIQGENNIRANLVGTEGVYQDINIYQPQEGRFINSRDIEDRANVIVLGAELAQELFEDDNSIGRTVRFNQSNSTFIFTIIGIMEDRERGMMGDFNNQAYIPITTYLDRIANSNEVDGFIAQTYSSNQATEAVNQINYFFEMYAGDSSSVRITSQDQILDTMNDINRSLSLMLGGIAAISLVVGGIGIMNIMLVSVTERTREIGIRKALGAKKKDILVQFLIESLALSGIGGILGVGVGYGGAYLISKIGDWPFIISPPAVIIAFSFSLVIGMFFGIYPAVKAAKLEPVEALSYE